ncbi:MAG: uroporphyrinogen decarboxylase [Planctomycetes bacterium]|nr:uroporphyrinogen decarboxylase [Planctomycetota bacterium]
MPNAQTLTSRQRFLAACRRQPVDSTPAWVMRQAGRYLPEYRAVRGSHDFLTMVRDPKLAAEVTLQPIRRFDMDAAVIFSDILVPCAAMGQAVSFAEGEGPSLAPHVRSKVDVDRLRDFDPKQATGFLGDAIRIVRKELGDAKAIIGFCGAPWTTASYMIEGGSSKNFEHSKRMLHAEPELFDRLCARLVDNLVPYLAMQVEAGADVVQIFDSWGGALDARTYRAALLPHVKRLVAGAKRLGVPVILYVNGCAQLLEVLADAEPDVLGLDWRVDPVDAIARVGARCAFQGNLDPCVLFATPEIVVREVERTLAAFAPQNGHIFNLGSGILPGTPVESMDALFKVIRGRRPRSKSAGAVGAAPKADVPDLLGQAERERLRQQITGTDAGSHFPAAMVDSILEEINAIRAKRLERHAFRVGQRVRVKEGPFVGTIGHVATLDDAKGTLHVTLVLSGHGHEFEFDWWQIESA